MYAEGGKSFSQVLEEYDPSEQYRGTAMENMDAYQRQLKRFDIKVKGAGSDIVEKFFANTESAVLFPEFVSRAVRQGMQEENILPAITATVTNFNGMDYRSIKSDTDDKDKSLRVVAEGAMLPETTVKAQNNLVKLKSVAVCWWHPMKPFASRDWICLRLHCAKLVRILPVCICRMPSTLL